MTSAFGCIKTSYGAYGTLFILSSYMFTVCTELPDTAQPAADRSQPSNLSCAPETASTTSTASSATSANAGRDVATENLAYLRSFSKLIKQFLFRKPKLQPDRSPKIFRGRFLNKKPFELQIYRRRPVLRPQQPAPVRLRRRESTRLCAAVR